MPKPETIPHETILSYCARQSLATELALEPESLSYIGMMSALGYLLILFTVNKPGDYLHQTTRSVKVPYDG